MVREHLIRNGNKTLQFRVQLLEDMQDQPKVHVLRGRLLHLFSIIETILKEYPGVLNNVTGIPYFGKVKSAFVNIARGNSSLNTNVSSGGLTITLQQLENALNNVNPERTGWAHGISFYKEREIASVEKPNNYIYFNNSETRTDDAYFNNLNDQFKIIIEWLKEKNLWKLNNFNDFEEFIV